MKEQEKNLGGEIDSLKKLLKKTIEEKDKKFIDTVDEMQTQRRVEVDTLRNVMLQQKEIALSAFEVKAY